jgi:hypothetical protein
MKVTHLVEDGETPTSISFSLSGMNATILRENMCGRKQRMVVQVILSIDRPVERDFWLIAHDAPLSIPCVEGSSDLSCRTSASYYYVEHSVTNCLGVSQGVEGELPLNHYTPLYYYYESVVMNNTEILGDPRRLLCGENWLTLYQRTRLHEYCHYYNPLYVKPKAWYEAALKITSAWLNGNRGVDVWVGMEALERTCLRRDAEVLYEETIFANITQWLEEEEEPTYDKKTLCAWIEEAGVDTSHSNITLPFFATHNIRDGFLSLFLYLVEPNDEMPVYVGILFSLPFFVALLTLIVLSFTLYHIYYRPPASDYELVK